MSVDLPEPETPVTQVKSPTGTETSMFFRLLPVAPRIASWRPGSFGLRRSGISILFSPRR